MIDIIGKRKYFFVFSIVLILTGIIGFLINGVQLDIQFEGGTLMQIEMNDNDYDTDEVEQVFKQAVNKEAKAQKLQTINAEENKTIYMLMLKVSGSETLTDEERIKVVDALRKEFDIKQGAEMQMNSVEPFIGRELRNKGIQAAIYASVLIIIYIWWRFSVMSGLSAAIMAVIALIHDALIMFSVYTIFQLPLNESFVAAVLTILGYSMNDTIIIYDRVRENSRLLKKVSISELVNKSIIQTLARSINTVATVLICIITVYLFSYHYNIQSLKEFSLPLIVGLASGGYSSIFIASPLWAMWREHKANRAVARRA